MGSPVIRNKDGEKVRGIYMRVTSDGRAALVCNCGYCVEARKARGEQPVAEMRSADLRETLDLFAESGMNLILLCLPGDVLSPDNENVINTVVREAHARGMEVHPVCWALAGEAPRPEFRMVNAEGKAVPYSDPGNPALRAFVIHALANLLRRCAIDGISLDGVRYVETELSGDCCYCSTCRDQFRRGYGYDPIVLAKSGKEAGAREQAYAPGMFLWNKARCENVTAFVRELKAAMSAVRREALLSAYVWGYASRLVFQDWPTWLEEGYLDWINPSGYTYGRDAFWRRCLDVKYMRRGEQPLCITLGPHTSHGRVADVEELVEQMEIARQTGADGVIFFTHSIEELHAWLPRLSQVRL